MHQPLIDGMTRMYQLVLLPPPPYPGLNPLPAHNTRCWYGYGLAACPTGTLGLLVRHPQPEAVGVEFAK